MCMLKRIKMFYVSASEETDFLLLYFSPFFFSSEKGEVSACVLYFLPLSPRRAARRGKKIETREVRF